MKKVLAITLSLAMTLLLCVGCGGGSKDFEITDGTIKIGVFEPASGMNGAGGKQEMLGMQYAHDLQPTVTVGGEEYDVELVYADNESDNSKAVTAAETLVSENSSIILGSYGSGVSIAAGPTFSDAGIPALGVSCTNQQVTSDCDVYSRICFLDPFQGQVLAQYAWDAGYKKAYTLSQLGDDYSVNLAGCFKTSFEELGGTVVSEEQFPEKNSDFTSYIANAKKAGAEVFFSPVSIESAMLIIDQANAQDIGMPILAGDTWDSNKVAESAKGTNLDVTCSTFYAGDKSADFDNAIKAWINEDNERKTNNGDVKGIDTQIAAVTALGYDAYNVALEAIKAADSANPADILTALPSVEYTGVTGAVKFNETGDVDKDTCILKKIDTASAVWKFFKDQSAK